MKSLICLMSVLMISTAGCGPKPIADERPVEDVDAVPGSTEAVSPTRETDSNESGVNVQVGGPQGIQVDVDREPDAGN